MLKLFCLAYSISDFTGPEQPHPISIIILVFSLSGLMFNFFKISGNHLAFDLLLSLVKSQKLFLKGPDRVWGFNSHI